MVATDLEFSGSDLFCSRRTNSSCNYWTVSLPRMGPSPNFQNESHSRWATVANPQVCVLIKMLLH